MKKFVIFLMSIILLSSCGGKSNKREIAEKFLEGYKTNDLEAMTKNIPKEDKDKIYNIDMTELKPQEQSLITNLNNELNWEFVKEGSDSTTFKITKKDLDAITINKSFKIDEIPIKEEEINFKYNNKNEIINIEEIFNSISS